MRQQSAEIVDSGTTVPLYKIGQGLTREVQDGNAEAGEFIDTLTGDGVGTAIGFILSYYQVGRFAADRDSGKSYVAWSDTIPESWADFVGEQWVGTSFAEHPDAEETFKKDVNEKRREWKSGPPIQTTHNFTGLAVVPGLEDDDEDALVPARLSLKSTDTPQAVKWLRLARAKLRRRPFWDIVFDLTTKKNEYKKGAAYNLVVSAGRLTTPEERQEAAELARLTAQGRVSDNSVDVGTDAPAAPASNGGLGV